MATSDVKLLGAWPSPYVNRVVMALKIKSIQYELIEINPHENPKPPLLVKTNPVYKKIPVLIHGDSPICESLAIIEYIDETWPDGPSILPSDPYDRAVARFWASYIDGKWYLLLRKLQQEKDEEVKRAIKEEIHEGLRLLEGAFVECSKGGSFFSGEQAGYLDIVLGCKLGWIRVTEMVTGGDQLLDVDRTPKLVEWAERMYSEDTGVKDVMLDPKCLMEVLIKFRATFSKDL